MSFEEIGKGIKYKVENNKLLIQIDLSKSFGTSSSGKSEIIASSSGNKNIGNNIFMGLNIYKPIK